MAHVAGQYSTGKKSAQKYQNTFKYKHNKASKKTAHILALPLGGCCRRCMDVLQWRQEFRKYKPIKTPKHCKLCEKRTITQAYMTACAPCAKEAAICAKCGEKTPEGLIIPVPISKEAKLKEKQKLEYEMRFMSERERRKIRNGYGKRRYGSSAGSDLGDRDGDFDEVLSNHRPPAPPPTLPCGSLAHPPSAAGFRCGEGRFPTARDIFGPALGPHHLLRRV